MGGSQEWIQLDPSTALNGNKFCFSSGSAVFDKRGENGKEVDSDETSAVQITMKRKVNPLPGRRNRTRPLSSVIVRESKGEWTA